MTTIIFARHGQTIWHEGHRYAGVSDIPLTESGYAAADALGAWAKTAHLDAIYASPLQRAVRTAEPAAALTGLDVVIDDDLIEVDFGLGEGKTIPELRPVYPRSVAEFEFAPAERPLPDGEPGRHSIERYHASIARIRAAQPDGRVLVVSHGTAIRLITCDLLGIDPNRYRDLMPEMLNCGRTTFEFRENRVIFHGFNAETLPVGS